MRRRVVSRVARARRNAILLRGFRVGKGFGKDTSLAWEMGMTREKGVNCKGGKIENES